MLESTPAPVAPGVHLLCVAYRKRLEHQKVLQDVTFRGYKSRVQDKSADKSLMESCPVPAWSDIENPKVEDLSDHGGHLTRSA